MDLADGHDDGLTDGEDDDYVTEVCFLAVEVACEKKF